MYSKWYLIPLIIKEFGYIFNYVGPTLSTFLAFISFIHRRPKIYAKIYHLSHDYCENSLYIYIYINIYMYICMCESRMLDSPAMG